MFQWDQLYTVEPKYCIEVCCKSSGRFGVGRWGGGGRGRYILTYVHPESSDSSLVPHLSYHVNARMLWIRYFYKENNKFAFVLYYGNFDMECF